LGILPKPISAIVIFIRLLEIIPTNELRCGRREKLLISQNTSAPVNCCYFHDNGWWPIAGGVLKPERKTTQKPQPVPGRKR
jgi:hypothetical protein